ncbi:MAG: hypothetical protein A2W28_04270 [Gammaproteobacteria bacterium RBG_16_51_14]|nr:MAG: hypothetical protein A2W28_04270 [Gammaproteobacteria bacterium RBG_16_51_14]
MRVRPAGEHKRHEIYIMKQLLSAISTVKRKIVQVFPGRDGFRRAFRLPGQAGFTIIELMMTLAVAGILAAMAAPSMRNTLLNQRVKTAASDAHISFLLARSEAIKRSVDIEVERNTSWSNGWDVQIPASTILRTQDPLPGMSVDCNTDADASAETCPASITYKRTGRLDQSDSPFELRFYVTGNNLITMRCVSLGLSGQPHIDMDTDGNTADGCD